MNEQEITNTEQLENQDTAPASTSDDDIFNEIFGEQEIGKYVAQQSNPVESEPSEVPVDVNPKEDPSQFQYWQSQADKKDAELQELKSRLDKVEAQSQPAQTQPTPAPEVPQEIVKPVKPVKPSDFDSSEALTDPNSKSAKYVAARDSYLDDMTEYYEKQETQRNMAVQQQIAQQKKASSEAKLVNDLQTNYGYTPAEAQDFIVKMSAPESLSLDNLVKLHRGFDQEQIPAVQPSTADLQLEVLKQRKEKMSIPKPITTQPSVNVQSSKKIEDQMMDSMIGNYKKKNPFI
jgi:hypothetical protein